MSHHTIALIVNGQRQEADVPARRLLSDFLRDDLHLTGTKRGCETGVCGACSVLVDGEVVKSCLSLAVHADGCAVTTVEGLAQDDGLQCGYCTPGFLIASCALLARNPAPSEHEVRHGLNGNLCRCTGYTQIVESVLDAAEKMNGN
jgi:carbon-monoxide dehydrogenase small subunit